MIVDYDGRILARAEAGTGTKIVVGPIDIAALRHERERRHGHHLLAHLRMEAYPAYRANIYPAGAGDDSPPTVERNELLTAQARRRLRPGASDER